MNKKICRKMLSLMLIGFISIGMFSALNVARNVSAASPLTLKWRIFNYVETCVGPVAEDLMGDDRIEIVVTGIRRSDGIGVVSAINGTNGAIIWEFEDSNIGNHNPCDIVDLNNDGFREIVVPTAASVLVLHGNNGTLYWKNTACKGYFNYQAIFDIDGDGYSEIFVCSGTGPSKGYDYITCLDYQGNILHQAWSWHPCWGGLTIGDTNFDGTFELYQGDRRVTYSATTDAYKGGGMGVRALDAHTLTPLWNDPTILCSSQAPILADVDKDGILDVIVADQSNSGIAVLNSADGSVLTTGGKYRKGSTNMPAHSNPTVYDIDGDGNLELMDCREYSPVKIWDLYEWKLDATLGVNCYEPPKLGDVTGDGELDIIAVNNTRIYVYTYNKLTGQYDLVDYVSGLYGRCNAFTVVQDVDDDGYNELVVTSTSGSIYCFDTPAPTQTPRPRSGLHFYSEYRWGAAVYVPPPIPSGPVLIDEQPLNKALNQPLNPTLSIRATDFQGDLMSITFRTNASGRWTDIDSFTNAPNGVYSVTTTGMDKLGTAYYWSVVATDGNSGTISKTYSFTTYSDPPTQGKPILASDSNRNLLASNQTTIDTNGDEVTNTYNWYRNDTSLTNLLLPFNSRTTYNPLLADELFSDGFEYGFDNWNDNGATDWDRPTNQKYSGSYSAHAGSDDNYLSSDNMDTSSAEGITVSFWYRDHGIDDDDNVYLQFWNGLTYVSIFELGNTKPEDTWHHYSIQTYQRSYLIPNFRIRFNAVGIDSGEDIWIDDLKITAPLRSKDYSSYDNHATIHGAVWTDNGVVGGAYIFDGSNDFMRIQDDSSLGGNGTWSEITVEFWIKPLTTNYGAIIIAKKEPQLSVGSYIIGFEADSALYSANTLFFGINSTYDNKWYKTSSSSTVLEVGKWYYITCVYKSGLGLSIYINGTERVNMPLTGNIAPNPGISVNGAPLFIGYDGGSDYRTPSRRWLNAYLDEIRIYPKALSQSQIFQRFLETKNGSTSNSTIVSEEATLGETWRAEVTPNDSFGDGVTELSNPLTITVPPVQYSLVIEASVGGTTSPVPGTYLYDEGSIVSVTALPDSGWVLSHWLLNGSEAGSAVQYDLTINANYTLTAVFAEVPPV
ncbi:MAG: LamG-like jellyroll fold domain-containing protein, partial [Candidatus Bathyarchaeia archaeon]